MRRPTVTAIEQVPLETPYGTVRLLFESQKECRVLLPDEHTEPPTTFVTMDGVSIEGSLVFELWGKIWECQRDHERSRCYDVATDCRISRELSDKLAQKLSRLLRQWVKANPDFMNAIDQTLLQQSIERLEADIRQLNDQMQALFNRKTEQLAALHKLQQRLRDH